MRTARVVRVLFDHNLPHKLRTNLGALGNHEIVTASYLGWSELKNGELLRAAEENGFEIFVTGDRSLVYEQNLTGHRLAIVALSTNNWPIIKHRVSQILAAIDSAVPVRFRRSNAASLAGRIPPAGNRSGCVSKTSALLPLGASAILLTTVRNLLSGLRLEKGPVSYPRRQ
jgi:predicted nuclease of predicted toxin-antitoxin system